MKSYNVGVILSTSYVVDADSKEEAEELARELAEKEYFDINIEEINFVELLGEDDETK